MLLILWALWAALACAIPAPLLEGMLQKATADSEPTETLKERQLPFLGPPLPTVTLPYGTWRANSYDQENDIYVFKNIRFAAPPVGDLRFSKPAPPTAVQGVQDGSVGHACIPAPGGLGSLIGPLAEPLGNLVFGAGASEDCLFLDVYVPGKAIKNASASKLPVILWIYGGAYIIGSKDGIPNYAGTPIIKASNGSVIWVASNYRLGPYGWLGGTTMEKEATPNAALWDQRAALQWIQDYIGLFGGDKTKVSAWGESAGAGSLFHHLIAFGGKQDPLFTRAWFQSPAYEPAPDRKGISQDKFNIMLRETGCTGQGVACLRKASTDQINKAAGEVFKNIANNTFGFGPMSDGQWVREFPYIEFLTGNYWKNMESILVSHTSNEAAIFSPKLANESEFDRWVRSLYPSVPFVLPKIREEYDEVTDINNRTALVVGDSSFLCNIAPMARAYPNKTYTLQYSRGSGIHGTDLLSTFYGPGLGDLLGLISPGDGAFGDFSTTYQRYGASAAVTGNPNTLSLQVRNSVPPIEWPTFVDAPQGLGNTLDAGAKGYSLITDSQTWNGRCEFWVEFAKFFTNEQGYAPPGASLPSKLTGGTVAAGSPEASRNYQNS